MCILAQTIRELTFSLLIEDHILQRVAVHRGQSVVGVRRRTVVDIRPGPVVSLFKHRLGRRVASVVGALLDMGRQVVGGSRSASLAVPQALPQPKHTDVVGPGQAQRPDLWLLTSQQTPHPAGAQLPQSSTGHILQLLRLPLSLPVVRLSQVWTLVLHPLHAVDEVLCCLQSRADIAHHIKLLQTLHGCTRSGFSLSEKPLYKVVFQNQ